ncbi:proteasome stabiliser-domain-containing protein [Blastocladiella britannica]|nr:proteasome stabiliser-domain-containing protein [Blastocladiella britannica]
MDPSSNPLDRAELVFALADSDDKLQHALTTHLAPTLRALGVAATQTRAMQLLSHINARVRPTPSLVFPCAALATLLADPAPSATAAPTRSFAAMYLDQGLGRASLSATAKIELVPALLGAVAVLADRGAPAAVAARPTATATTALVRAIAALEAPPLSDPHTQVADAIAALDLAPEQWTAVYLALAHVQRTGLTTAAATGTGTGAVLPAESWKRAVLSFAVFYAPAPAAEANWARAYLLFLGSCDPVAPVADHADTCWRKARALASEDPAMVRAVLALYLAQSVPSTPPSTSDAMDVDPPAMTPAVLAIKTKALAYATKSKAAANAFPTLLKVIFDALFARGTIPKVQQAGMGYLQWVARSADQAVLDKVAPILMSGTIKTIEENLRDPNTGELSSVVQTTPVVELAIIATGLILQRVPSQLTPDTLTLLFSLAKSHPPQLKLAVTDCLGASLVPLTPETAPLNLATILPPAAQTSSSDLSRYMALRWAAKLEPGSLDTLAMHIKLSADPAGIVRQEALAGLDATVRGASATTGPSVASVLAMLVDAVHATTSSVTVRGDTAWSVREIAVDFGWRYIATRGAGWRRAVVPADVLRTYPFASGLKSWIAQAPAAVVADWTAWLTSLIVLDGAPISLQTTCIGHVYFLRALGAAPTQASATAGLTARFYEHTSTVTQWRLRTLLPAQFDAPATIAGVTHSQAIRAAELMRTMDVTAASQALSESTGSGTLLVESAAILVLQESMMRGSLTSQQAAEVVATVEKVIGMTNITPEVVCSAVVAAAWAGRTQQEAKEKVIKIITETLPALPIARTHPTVTLAIGDAAAILVAGSSAACVDYDRYDTSATRPPVDEEVATKLVAAASASSTSSAAKPVRRTHLHLLDSLVSSVPTLSEKLVLDAHETAARALLVPDLAASAARAVLAVHLHRPELSSQLMPQVSRALQSAPAAAATSRAFVVFDALVGVAREAGCPDAACAMVGVVNRWGMLDDDDSAGATAATAAARASSAFAATTVGAAAAASATMFAVDAHEYRDSVPVSKVVPILFRVASHPNPHISAAAAALVKGLTMVSGGWPPLSAYHAPIFALLLRSMSHSVSSVRESALLALLDALKTDPAAVTPYLTDEVCRAALRLLDDVHEPVQQAAVRTSSVVISRVPPATAVPFLLDSLKSSAAPVTKFALTSLMRMCSAAAQAVGSAGTDDQAAAALAVKPQDLVPLVPSIVTALLEALSALEPQVMNYISFHVHKYDMTTEQLDARRLALLQSSPVMSTLENLVSLPSTTEDVDALCAALTGVIRKGVGLPTRGGVARVILTLRPATLRASTTAGDSILKALSGGVFDANSAVRHVMAAAAAHIVGSGSVETPMVTKFLSHLTKTYATGATDRRPMVAEVAAALVKTPGAKDAVGKVLDVWMPTAAVGMHATAPVPQAGSAEAAAAAAAARNGPDDRSEASLWRSVWASYINVDATGVRLYGSEIARAAGEWFLATQDWGLQDQAARTLKWLISVQQQQQSVSNALLFAVDDTVVTKLVQSAMQHKREALLVGAIAVSAFTVRGHQKETDVTRAATFLEWLTREVTRSHRGYPLAVDFIDQAGPAGASAVVGQVRPNILDTLLLEAAEAYLAPDNERKVKAPVLIDLWAAGTQVLDVAPASMVAPGHLAALLSVYSRLAVARGVTSGAVTDLGRVVRIAARLPPALGMHPTQLLGAVANVPQCLASSAMGVDAQVAVIRVLGELCGMRGEIPSLALANTARSELKEWVRRVLDRSQLARDSLAPLVRDEVEKLEKSLA